MTQSSDAGARPSRHGGQSVSESIVFGDIFQVEAAGDVTIRAERPPYRVEDFPAAPVALSVAKARAQPSRLLLAQHAVVAFTGREQQLRDQATWLANGEPVAVRLVHGAGGQGKTRLASRLAAEAVGDGWRVWQALHGGPAAARLALPARTESLLMVVDYADRWPASQLTALVRQLHSLAGRAGTVVRVLLLARSAGFWWSAVANKVDSELGIEADEQELGPLGTVVARAGLFATARDAFAAAMDVGPVGHIQAPDQLDDEAFAQVLSVHMAALATVDAYRHADSAPTDPEAISTYLLRRERAYWHGLHARTEDKLPTAPRTMGRAVYVATLAGGLPRDDAQTVLSRARVTSTLETANQLLDDHCTCYPPGRGDLVLEPLHPDRLGEDFIALTTPGHARDTASSDDWAASAPSRLLTGVQDEAILLLPSYTAHAVSVLIEVARRWPHAAHGQLYPLLREQPWLALAAGSAAMARLADLDDVDIDVLEAIEQLIPSQEYFGLYAGIAAVTQRLTDSRLARTNDPAQRGRLYWTLGKRLVNAGLREQALIACKQAVDVYRALAATPDASEPGEPGLARALNTLGVALAQLGRREEALAATTEAVEVYRRLGRGEGANLPDLARALVDHSNRLSEWGRREDALAAATEAVEIRRQLGSEPELAVSLVALGAQLSELGRAEEGLIALNEAADILGQLNKSGSAVFDPYLAIALNNIGMALSRLGQWEHAVAAMSATVNLRRRLATTNPDAFEAELGGSLANLGAALSELGRREEALEVTTEAVEVYRRLAQENPAAFEPGLGQSLANLGKALSELGRREEALEVTTEAVEVYRRLAQENPAAFEPGLGQLLANLGGVLSGLGRRQEALEVTTEAVEVYRRLAQENPAAFEQILGGSLTNLGEVLSRLGRREEALEVTTEAVEVYRRLAQENPAAIEPDLARVLSNHSADLSDQGRRREALAAIEEAVESYRHLAQANPAAFEPGLAEALLNLGAIRFSSEIWEAALTATSEAVEIYRELAEGNAAAFESRFAAALSNVSLMLIHRGHREEALTSTSEAVKIYRRLAQGNPALFRADLARVLLVAALVRSAGKVGLSRALSAAEEALAIYQDLAASHPAAFTDELTRAQGMVANILDSLREAKESVRVGHPWAMAGSQLVVGDDIREELDEMGLTQVMASLYPVDCQTCGLPIGGAQAVLHVDDFGAYADAALHHSGCKTSEWNRVSSNGLLIIQGAFSQAYLSWTCLPLMIPTNAGYLPMLLVNPGLEFIRLGRNPSGQWRVEMEERYRDAGLTQQLRLGKPIEGATARISNGCVVVEMRRAPFQSYGCELSDRTEVQMRKLSGLIFAVTHAVNPADISRMQDLESVFVGDRSLMGWVKIEEPGTSSLPP